MFIWLSEYLEKRKDIKDQERWNEGFDWAAGVLLRGEMTVDEIEALTELIHHPFDRGARAAVELLLDSSIVRTYEAQD